MKLARPGKVLCSHCRRQADALGNYRTKHRGQDNALLAVLIFVAHYLPAITLATILLAITNNLSIGYGVLMGLILVTWLSMRRIYRRK